jgi:hypothetical protein
MKLIYSVVVLLICFNLFSLVVDSTATMNQTELQQLYDGCTGGDIVLTAMYGWYQSDTRDDEEIGFLESLREYEPINLAGSYLELAFESVIDA